MVDRRLQHETLLVLEQPGLKVAYEQLHRAFRSTRKHLEKESSALTQFLEQQQQQQQQQKQAESSTSAVVDAQSMRLTTLKRKLKETQQDELKHLKRCRARVQHLEQLFQLRSMDDDGFEGWSRVRLKRLLVDHLLRAGYHLTARQFIDLDGLDELVDEDLFLTAKRIQEALMNRSCAECLQWCTENRSALKKIKSSLEFQLRVQEFVEILRRSNGKLEAIRYARKHFSPWVDTHLPDIQKAMSLLAFPSETPFAAYKQFYAEGRWRELVKQYHRDNFALNNVPGQSLLSIVLQGGLTALKTPFCYQPDNQSSNCPVCNATFRQLSEQLPFSHHINSCIVCRITGGIMDEDNPPMVLPNGNVYSLKGLQMVASTNQGNVVDPRSGELFDLSQAKKVYLT